MDGKTNSIKNKGVALDGNYVPNAVDHAVFKKVEYVASKLGNPWSWGTADNIYLFDLSSGSLGTQAIDFEMCIRDRTTGRTIQYFLIYFRHDGLRTAEFSNW